MRRAVYILAVVIVFASYRPSARRARAAAPPVDEPAELDLRDINLGFADADEGIVGPLIEQLGDCDFLVREAATAQLTQLGPRTFRQLSRSYRLSDDYETRIRIAQITQESYLWHSMLKHRGFLGISYKIGAGRDGQGDAVAILIDSVQEGSAAAEAGLQSGDRIITLDSEHVTARGDGAAFRNVIESKGAGGKLAIQIERQGAALDVDVTLQARPLRYYADQLRPELLDELNHRLQAYSLWWARHFSTPRQPQERASSSAVFELPE